MTGERDNESRNVPPSWKTELTTWDHDAKRGAGTTTRCATPDCPHLAQRRVTLSNYPKPLELCPVCLSDNVADGTAHDA